MNVPVIPKPSAPAWDPFLGKTVLSFGVPDDATSTTWWSNGPKPGSVGVHQVAVIIGHTEIGADNGVFQYLGNLKVGDLVQLDSVNPAESLKYQVFAVHPGLNKNDATALHDAIAYPPALCATYSCVVLVTCSGNIGDGGYSHEQNTAVYARLL